MSKKNYTHISVVIDRSGSMSSCWDDTIGGFNSFLATQKEETGKATMTIAQFDNEYDVIANIALIKDIEDLTRETYTPRGGTALFDAIGRTINATESDIAKLDKKPEKVIFVIITDGDENASREYSRNQIMKMIDDHREENKWEFVFIGANQDALKNGSSMGIRKGFSANYDASAAGTKHMFSSLTTSMSDYRSRSVKDDLNIGFFNDPNATEAEEDTEDVDTD